MRRSGSDYRITSSPACLRWTCYSACLLLLGVCSAVCGSSSGTVQGRVTLDGSPLALGMVLFHPTDDPVDMNAAGTIAADGQYKLRAPGGSDAIPTGTYHVTIHAGDGDESYPRPAPIPTRYQRVATSGLSADVALGKNKIDFSLQSNSL